jgi:hypothetical protein
MSGPDGYVNDMDIPSDLSERDVDLLLAGRDPADGSFEDLAILLKEAREVLLRQPSDRVRARHLQLLAAARPSLSLPAPGSLSSRPPSTFVRGRSTWVLRKLVVALVALTTTGGLALAGVDLPSTADERAFDAIPKVNIPQQADVDVPERARVEGRVEIRGPADNAHDTAIDLLSLISNWPSDRGCYFGQAIADTATSGEHGPKCTGAANADGRGDEAFRKGRRRAEKTSSAGPGATRRPSQSPSGTSRTRGRTCTDDAEAGKHCELSYPTRFQGGFGLRSSRDGETRITRRRLSRAL